MQLLTSMTVWISLTIVAFVSASAAVSAAGDTIVLKDGTVYVGTIQDVTSTSVVAQLSHPEAETRTFAREELTDSTLWRILTIRLPDDDPESRMALGRWAEDRGLLTPALFEYRRAVKSKAHEAVARERILALENTLALDLFDRGEELLLLGKAAASRQYFRLILEKYPKTAIAEVATLRIVRVDEEIAAVLEPAKSVGEPVAPVAKDEWQRRLARVVSHAKKATRFEKDRVHGRQSVKQARELRKAAGHLEAAWRGLEDLGPAPDPAGQAVRSEFHRTLKERLLNTYLNLGLVYLLRHSMPEAESWCVKACELDPENASSHTLHKRIIETQLAGQWGISTHQRLSR